MPYVSAAQRGFFHANKKKIGPKVVEEFDQASKGQKKLPYHVSQAVLKGHRAKKK